MTYMYDHHYNEVIMSTMASQITSITIVHSTVYSGKDKKTHQSSASLAFVRGIHRWPVNSPHKWPVTRKMFPFGDVIMWNGYMSNTNSSLALVLLHNTLGVHGENPWYTKPNELPGNVYNFCPQTLTNAHVPHFGESAFPKVFIFRIIVEYFCEYMHCDTYLTAISRTVYGI